MPEVPAALSANGRSTDRELGGARTARRDQACVGPPEPRPAPAGLDPGISPYFVSILVWSIGLSLGGTTGYAINPARDLGPRIAHAIWPISGKGSSDWAYAPVPILGPLLGAVLAALIIEAAHIA